MDREDAVHQAIPVSADTDDTCYAITDGRKLLEDLSWRDTYGKNGPSFAREGKTKEKQEVEYLSISSAIRRIEEMLVKDREKRNNFLMEKLTFEREKMYWDMAQSLLGPGSTVNVEERSAIISLLRKRLMDSLSRDDSRAPKKLSRRLGQRDISDAVTGMLGESHEAASAADHVINESLES